MHEKQRLWSFPLGKRAVRIHKGAMPRLQYTEIPNEDRIRNYATNHWDAEKCATSLIMYSISNE